MPHDIQFPPMCALCQPYYAPGDCPAGVYREEAIGDLCCACKRLCGRVRTRLKKTKGIAGLMIAPGQRNDRTKEGQR